MPRESLDVSETFKVNWKKMRDQAPYPPAAFDFVREGLAHTVSMVHANAAGDDDSRHVSGQQLCLGLRDYAIRQYGMLAKTVLNRWGVNRTEDFGNIVFAMIDAGLMRKTDEDHVDDFRDVFDFDEAFCAVKVG
jgi:uncharacterized repeat protein (TIGR04138 family)